MTEFDFMLLVRISVVLTAAIVGYIVVRFISNRFSHHLTKRLPEGIVSIVNYLLFYGLYLLVILIALQSVGINISALIAAAGVAGVAIGFAAQTSLSNIISGVMLLFEQSFKANDLISCNNMQGRVQSIGLLSVTLKTIDNRTIRIPNEQLIKSSMVNLSAIGTRRISFLVTIGNPADAQKVTELLKKAGDDLTFTLSDKPTAVSYDVASIHAVGLTADLWVKSKDVVAAKSAFVQACLAASGSQKVPFHVSVKPA